jgi:hypothetical protein
VEVVPFDSSRWTWPVALGSIGWCDTVYLPLLTGDNDLVVAVSEDIGGWGVQARFPDATGISFG